MAPPSPSSEPLGLPSPRFEVLEVLGRGASGLVHRVHDRLYGFDVAAKVLRPEALAAAVGASPGASPGTSPRGPLQAEFRLVSHLAHPNLVTLFELHPLEVGDGLFYTMQLVDDRVGPTPGERLPPAWLASAFSGLARGLAQLHAHGLVHGDLKPGNVFLRRAGPALLGDFGLTTLTGGRAHGATPRYASLELWETGVASPAADLYALGVVLWEAATGLEAFPGELESCLAQKDLREGRLPAAPSSRELAPVFAGLATDERAACSGLLELAAALTAPEPERLGLADALAALEALAGARSARADKATRSEGRADEGASAGPDRRAGAAGIEAHGGDRAEARRALGRWQREAEAGARRVVVLTGPDAALDGLAAEALTGAGALTLVARAGEEVPGRLHDELVGTGEQRAWPRALVIEDAQHADALSFERLGAELAGRPGGGLVVLAWRADAEGDAEDAGWWGWRRTARGAAIDRMVTALGAELRGLALRGSADVPGEGEAPGAAALDGLTREAERVLRLAALAGPGLPAAVLARASGLADGDHVAALGLLRARRLLTTAVRGAAQGEAWVTVPAATRSALAASGDVGDGARGGDAALHLALAGAWEARAEGAYARREAGRHRLLAAGSPEARTTARRACEALAGEARAAGEPAVAAELLRLVVGHGGLEGEELAAAKRGLAQTLVEAGGLAAAGRLERELGADADALAHLLLGGAFAEGRALLEVVGARLDPRLARKPSVGKIAFTTVWHHYLGRFTTRLERAPGPPGDAAAHLDRLALLNALALGHAVTDPMTSAYVQVLHLRAALRPPPTLAARPPEQAEAEAVTRALAIHLLHATSSGVSAARRAVAERRLAEWEASAGTHAARAVAEVARAGAAWLSGLADRARGHVARAHELLAADARGLAWELGSLALVESTLLEEVGDLRTLAAVAPARLLEALRRGDVHAESHLRGRPLVTLALARGDVAEARRELARARALVGLGPEASTRAEGGLEVFDFYRLVGEAAALRLESRGAEAHAFAEAATARLRGGLLLRTAYYGALVAEARVRAARAAEAEARSAGARGDAREAARLDAFARKVHRAAARKANPMLAARLDAALRRTEERP